MKILAFAATNSKNSINKQLVQFASSILSDHDIEIIDLNDYELPLYGIDRELASGIPVAAKNFLNKITEADALLISYAEHNGNYTAAYKNLFDWASRENRQVYQGKPIVMMATSPGPGGAKNVLSLATGSAQYFEGKVLGSFSLPSFNDNFDTDLNRITDKELLLGLEQELAKFSR